MALTLVSYKDGRQVGSLHITDAPDIHHLLAVLTVLFVCRLWQNEDVDGAEVDKLLMHICGLKALGLDAEEYELTEVDLQTALDSGAVLGLDYEPLFAEPLLSSLDTFSADAVAEIGWQKLVKNGMDAGVFSAGDVLDVSIFLETVKTHIVTPAKQDAEKLHELGQFFEEASTARAMIGVGSYRGPASQLPLL